MNSSKIVSFTDLFAWQKGHQLVLEIYKITALFPKSELYALTSQMRRCVVSITSNIAEGFSRKGKKEKAQFYYMSLGSTTELHNQLIIAKDLSYISEELFAMLLQNVVEVHKILTGLIKSLDK